MVSAGIVPHASGAPYKRLSRLTVWQVTPCRPHARVSRHGDTLWFVLANMMRPKEPGCSAMMVGETWRRLEAPMKFKVWPKRTAPVNDSAGTLRQARHVLATEQGDQLILLDLNGGLYYTLNRVGSLVWALLGVGATHDQIVSAIQHEFDVSSCTAENAVAGDVSLLLAKLYAAGLVTRDASQWQAYS